METPEDDPRGTDVAESGYPEEQEPGAQPGGGDHPRDDEDEDAPGTSSERDSGPDKATGNPDAAGG